MGTLPSWREPSSRGRFRITLAAGFDLHNFRLLADPRAYRPWRRLPLSSHERDGMEQLLDPKRRPPRARPGEWIHLGEAGPGHYKAENRPCVVTAVDPAFASGSPNGEDPQLITGARVEGMGDRQSLR